mmetsp:Transcript_4065/g.17034  ORF Transcript_4065/g.17034 Transcript_4065/m.17034 type:complete len:288 (+) Transcript_4065:3275-4138(+)
MLSILPPTWKDLLPKAAWLGTPPVPPPPPCPPEPRPSGTPPPIRAAMDSPPPPGAEPASTASSAPVESNDRPPRSLPTEPPLPPPAPPGPPGLSKAPLPLPPASPASPPTSSAPPRLPLAHAPNEAGAPPMLSNRVPDRDRFLARPPLAPWPGSAGRADAESPPSLRGEWWSPPPAGASTSADGPSDTEPDRRDRSPPTDETAERFRGRVTPAEPPRSLVAECPSPPAPPRPRGPAAGPPDGEEVPSTMTLPSLRPYRSRRPCRLASSGASTKVLLSNSCIEPLRSG